MKTKDAGFTLVEVLIAAAILTIVLAAVYSTFFLAERSVSGLEGYGLRLEESRRAMDILSREIRAALYSSSDSGSLFVLKDRENRGRPASELALTTLGTVREGFYRVSYYARQEGERFTLYKSMDNPYDGLEPVVTEVVEDLDSFSIKVKEGERWTGTWDTDLTGRLPEEVKMTITLRLKEKKVELSQSARPRMRR